MERQIQHGDVLLRSIKELPKGVGRAKREENRLIVAKGEATGHNHAIKERGASIWTMKREGIEQMFLEVADNHVTITHEEHKPIEIPKGIYEIGIVKEHDYIREMERQVLD